LLEFKYQPTHVNIKSVPCLGGHGPKVWTAVPRGARKWLDVVENNCTVKLDVVSVLVSLIHSMDYLIFIFICSTIH
jgi:hypothetical protein